MTLLDRPADKPMGSMPNACNGWAETQAAYRFWRSKGFPSKIFWQSISAVHIRACRVVE
jgi:hypothetical protein